MVQKTVMTDPVKEQLSACLDGELPEGELDLLIKQVSRDPAHRAALGRYALIGEALRAKSPAAASAGFADRISAAIAAEPALDTSGQRPNRIQPAAIRWLRPVAGLAVAAGVAAVAILTLQQPPQPDAPAATYAAQSQAPISAAVPERSVEESDRYIVPAGAASSVNYVPAARLTNYVVAHSEYSSPLGRRSVLSGVLAEEEGSDDAAPDDQNTPVEPEVVTEPR
jgi:sigma-E factor negative regulatory protein RseA